MEEKGLCALCMRKRICAFRISKDVFNLRPLKRRGNLVGKGGKWDWDKSLHSMGVWGMHFWSLVIPNVGLTLDGSG